jgi:hypothetical protein
MNFHRKLDSYIDSKIYYFLSVLVLIKGIISVIHTPFAADKSGNKNSAHGTPV